MKIFAFLFFVLFTVSGFSEETPVLDSFLGVKFGSLANAIDDNKTAIEFKPKKTFRNFTNYYCGFSPKSKKIYAIGMGVYFNSLDDAINECKIIVKVFTEHYKVAPKFFDENPKKEGRIVFEFSNGCSITITVAKIAEKYFLMVNARSEPLAVLSELEQINVEKSKTDTSAL